PLSKQKYAKQPKHRKKYSRKAKKFFLEKGYPLKTLPTASYNESDYDRSDKQEDIIVKNQFEFLERVTAEDPYRLEKQEEFYISGDFRSFYLSKYSKSDKGTFFPMAFDLGVRYRPTRNRFSFVWETRFTNSDPSKSAYDNLFSNPRVRSAYVLYDDLPYNTYIMGGLYRPLFGNYTPDHETLQIRLLEMDYKTIYQAISFGGSPNVPFANVHLIFPTNSSLAKDSGYALNLGGRFVTLGASIMLSYWNTKNDVGFNRTMYSLSGGLKLPFFKGRNIIYTGDIVNFDITVAPTQRRDSGLIFTNELKFQLWRENYWILNYAQSNVGYSPDTDKNRTQGSASEIMTGLKSFTVSGLETELLYIINNNEVSGTKTNSQRIQAQIHLFF
ncbi:MAG: hypothetical protein D6797_06995, partial [Bdellovibrio sp.]